MTIRAWSKLGLGTLAFATAMPAIAQQATAPKYGKFGVDLTAEDPAIKPGDDFWSFANGGWDKRTPFPADRPMAGAFIDVVDGIDIQVRSILDDVSAHSATFGQVGQQVGGFYASWMNTAALERKGAAPLSPYLQRIAAVRNTSDLQVLFATPGYATPVDVNDTPNLADPTRYVAAVSQSDLGMPRDYFIKTGARYDAYRTAYRALIQQMLTLAGIQDASAKAEGIFALETAMANAQWSPEELRDIPRMNDPETLAGLKAKAPEFDWALMLKTSGFDASPQILMATNSAITALGKIFASTPLQTWKDYLAFRFIASNAPYLSSAFDTAHWQFYSHTLSGTQAQRERWKRGVALLDKQMGEAVGQIYVKRYYPPTSEAKMGELIEDLRAAYKERFDASTWMDAKTRQAALVKLAAFDPRIGHPVKYIDYSSLVIDRDDLLGNVIRSEEFQHRLDLSRFPKPVDRGLWEMTPQTSDAYYNAQTNQITFPAGILQPPMFDPNADAAVNYGAIGAVIGHEMGHGFDDQGSQFGPTGKLENWWTDDAKKAFETRTAALAAQYSTFEPVPGVKLNGKLTLGENIGDLGGVEAAYAAFQRYQARHGKAPVIGGVTGDQRFFLAYAQAWRMKFREDLLRQSLASNPHSPPNDRVNGVIRNVDAWYRAFNVKPGDTLYLAPEQRVHIW
ncbi:M13 family metallopeptidase [Sphingomonas bacterium]|uniref:M13 family metallopeptidase n=1 Tax=Sphingomonas bacterium TaxID=1895847 RepID=UPI0015756C9F|nr:M13 family metallopeptidase [Sphingomonas bacterium]